MAITQKVLLIGEKAIKELSLIQLNVDSKVLRVTTLDTQFLSLRPLLGNTLFDQVLTAVAASQASPPTPIPTPVLTLITEYIQPFLCHAVVRDIIINLQYKITNKGLMQYNDTQAVQISAQDLEYARNHHDNNATGYKKVLIQYINQNFPNGDACSDAREKDTTSDAAGWYLDDDGPGCCGGGLNADSPFPPDTKDGNGIYIGDDGSVNLGLNLDSSRGQLIQPTNLYYHTDTNTMAVNIGSDNVSINAYDVGTDTDNRMVVSSLGANLQSFKGGADAFVGTVVLDPVNRNAGMNISGAGNPDVMTMALAMNGNSGMYLFMDGADLYQRLSFYGQDNKIELWLQAKDSAEKTGLEVTSSGLIITDDMQNQGAKYAADYSGNFVPLSLVTKQYVDNAVGALDLDLEQVTQNGNSTTSSLQVTDMLNTNFALDALNIYKTALTGNIGITDTATYAVNLVLAKQGLAQLSAVGGSPTGPAIFNVDGSQFNNGVTAYTNGRMKHEPATANDESALLGQIPGRTSGTGLAGSGINFDPNNNYYNLGLNNAGTAGYLFAATTLRYTADETINEVRIDDGAVTVQTQDQTSGHVSTLTLVTGGVDLRARGPLSQKTGGFIAESDAANLQPIVKMFAYYNDSPGDEVSIGINDSSILVTDNISQAGIVYADSYGPAFDSNDRAVPDAGYNRLRFWRQNGIYGTFTMPTATQAATFTRNSADNVHTFVVNNANASSTGMVAAFRFNGTDAFLVGNGYAAANVILNQSGGNNSRLDLQTSGVRLSRNVADTNVAVIVDNANASNTGRIIDFRFNGVNVGNIDNSGRVYAGSFAQQTSANNALLQMGTASTASVFSRNVADANAALIVQQTNATSTGNIQQWSSNTGTVGYFNRTGTFALSAICNISSVNNSAVTVGANGTVVSRNIADANTALIVDQLNASSTGAMQAWRLAGANKARLDVAGNFFAQSLNLNLLTVGPVNSTDAGTVGNIRIDSNYIYVCVATNTWKRVALTTW